MYDHYGMGISLDLYSKYPLNYVQELKKQFKVIYDSSYLQRHASVLIFFVSIIMDESNAYKNAEDDGDGKNEPWILGIGLVNVSSYE